ncbi:MAG: AMP-binding protein [Alphaproteobacteria bacterium]|nr:AMP-binding protein [Alphaproteobacteria bacterium]
MLEVRIGPLNRIRTAQDWRAARRACIEDPGAFHGRQAISAIHWFAKEIDGGAWLTLNASGQWTGWSARTLEPVSPALGADFRPWTRDLVADDPPNFRWFEGGLTNACFNEVDRHVLAGHGDEAALIFEGDRWDGSLNNARGGPVESFVVTRKKLLLETAKCFVSLRNLGLRAGDRLAINMPNIPQQIYWIEAAKRLGVVYTPVFGGFSDKTLSDRIHDFGARVVVTADGGHRNSQVIPFKAAFTDPALDNFIGAADAKKSVAAAMQDLSLAGDEAIAIVSAVETALAGETTVERGDVMRGVGRALATIGLDAERAAAIRSHIAEALVRSPARADAVVVEKHASPPDMIWRPERDRWAHDLKATALDHIIESARDAGYDVDDEASLLALRDVDFVRAIWASAPPTPLDSECPMFVIYTSGSTGKPKGVVHVQGGYTAGIAATMPIVFGAEPGDVMYVVADPGWITGQSYLISAPLTTRITTVIAEGAPVYPHAGRFASIIERHGVKIFKAGVTFLKSVMQDPESVADVRKYDLSSLRAATFCAEPTSPAVQEFGMREVTPFYMNSYWATEHGGIVWTHFFDSDDFKLSANAHAFPLPWVLGDIWLDAEAPMSGDVAQTDPPPADLTRADNQGAKWRRAQYGEKGEIVIVAPYPYLARTIWGDLENFRFEGAGPSPAWKGDAGRYAETYWKRWAGVWAYTQGDFGMPHTDGSISIHGRSDDVINVSGHRLGTEEIEGAILRDKSNNPQGSPVGNVIVVGAPHREKGLTPLAFVTPTPGRTITAEDRRRLSDLVRSEKGSLAIPSDFIEVPAFPETRSGKYVRRMVRAIVEDGPVGDASTLKNPESLDQLRIAIDRWKRRQDAADSQKIFERYRFFLIQYNNLGMGRRVATVYVDNPPVNALNERALDELNTIVEHLERRKDVAAIVFTGRGAGTFVAGADIRQFLDEINTLSEARALPNNAHLAFKRIEEMNKPCIAAINGVALGGGMEFALACHYRVAEPFARFGQPEIRLRLLPGYGGTQRLPRILADKRGKDGLIDALELLLGGRSIDAEDALAKGLIDELVTGKDDALGRAHALVRELDGDREDTLARAHGERIARNDAWRRGSEIDLGAALADDHLAMIARQCEWAGRAGAYGRCLDAISVGWRDGIDAGLAREAALFAEAVIDPDGGKTGIRDFMEKRAKPLPIRRGGVRLAGDGGAALDAMMASGDLLPVGAPFFPGVTKIPTHQFAHGVYRDVETGEPRFGAPSVAETQLIATVDRPGPNEALVYVLASEINFNDIWAITGIPVSAFDSHEGDIQTTGSGGVALVASLGEEARREGRLKVGDLVAIYSGTNDLLSPLVGLDPMYADFSIQGYETPTGSHAQFLVCQAPQLHPVRADLKLEEAGAFTLNLGTVVRALFTTLKIEAGRTVFVEGAATGTGFDALKSAMSSGLSAIGLVSNEDRAEAIRVAGAAGAINRKAPAFAGLFTQVPEGADAAREWERAGAPLLEACRDMNGGRLVDYAVSHAGETAFPRTFQLLEQGGVVAFYGASSGYHFTFVGKDGAARPGEMLTRAGLRGNESALAFYGPASMNLSDPTGLEILEELRAFGVKTAVATTTDAQRDFILSLGFEDAVAGVVSLESLKRRLGDEFDWPSTMPRLPDSKTETEAFKRAVRDFQERTMKPFGGAVGRLLRSPDNPRGAPDLIFERATFDSLGVSSALVKPYTGRVVYSETLKDRRFSFYAPQVWTRQRRIIMPTAEIRGTHLCNAYEAAQMHDLVAAGVLTPTSPTVIPWEELPSAHQAMWDNAHAGATYIVNHALPQLGLKSRDELFEAWSAVD